MAESLRGPCEKSDSRQSKRGLEEQLVTLRRGEKGSSSSSQPQCRICLESDGDDFIAPCQCKGSAKYVHRACLDQWRSTKEGPAFSQCTTCRARYHLSVHPPRTGTRVAKFGLLVARDTLAISFLSQVCVALYALAAFLLDCFAGSKLRRACGFQSPVTFYYAFGLSVFFFVAGMLGRQVANAQREEDTIVILTVRSRRRRDRRRVRVRNGNDALTLNQGGAHPSEGAGEPLVFESSPPAEAAEGAGDAEGSQARELGEGGRLPGLHGPTSTEDLLRDGSSSQRSISDAGSEFDIEEGLGMVSPLGSPSGSGQAGAGGEGVEGGRGAAPRPRSERRLLLRFRHTVELTPEAMVAGCGVAFFVGLLAIALIELGVVTDRLDGFFVLAMAMVSVPTGVLYSLKMMKTIWDSHRCIFTKRALTEEYVVEDLDGCWAPSLLPSENEQELKDLGLW